MAGASPLRREYGGSRLESRREGDNMTGDSATAGEGTVHLRDGRSLTYATWGDPHGKPVLLFHGSPSSRLFRPSVSVTASCGVRLITVDRPGYGRSDFQAGRRLLDWPDDVAALADAMGLDSFAVVGHSSGGPYALACATMMASRISGVGLVSTVVPVDEVSAAHDDLDDDDRELVDLARREPAEARRRIEESARWLLEEPEAFLQAPRPEPDRLLLEDPEVRSMFVEMIRESVRSGLAGHAWNEVVERNPWGFSLKDIEMEVHVWHGDQDHYIPRAYVEHMADLLPRCRATIYPDEAHGMIISRWKEILTTLTRSEPR
jgi:pimeloyl-ACP methyl ester carboxylesterase